MKTIISACTMTPYYMYVKVLEMSVGKVGYLVMQVYRNAQ